MHAKHKNNNNKRVTKFTKKKLADHESKSAVPRKPTIVVKSRKSKEKKSRSVLFLFNREANQGRMTPGVTLWHLRRSTKGCEVPGTSKVDSI